MRAYSFSTGLSATIRSKSTVINVIASYLNRGREREIERERVGIACGYTLTTINTN